MVYLDSLEYRRLETRVLEIYAENGANVDDTDNNGVCLGYITHKKNQGC